MERALLDAAVSGDAYDTDTMMAVLRPMTRLTEITDAKTGKGTGKFEVKVDFPDTDPNTGEPTVTLHTPDTAVKRMKELPKYVNLFKSGVVSGIGSNAATGGLTPGATARLDPRNLIQEQYMEIRAKNPELLGLRPRRKGQQPLAVPSQGFVVRSRTSRLLVFLDLTSTWSGNDESALPLARRRGVLRQQLRRHSANFIPELWAAEGLAILQENMVIANLVHRDFENEIRQFGDVVNTRRPGTFQIRRKKDGTTLQNQDATATNVRVPLDQWFYTSFTIKDGEASKSFQDLVDIYLRPGMITIARSVDRAVLGRVHGFLGGPTQPRGPAGQPLGGSNSKDYVLEARETAERQQGPAGGPQPGPRPGERDRAVEERTVHRRPAARRLRHGVGERDPGKDSRASTPTWTRTSTASRPRTATWTLTGTVTNALAAGAAAARRRHRWQTTP